MRFASVSLRREQSRRLSCDRVSRRLSVAGPLGE